MNTLENILETAVGSAENNPTILQKTNYELYLHNTFMSLSNNRFTRQLFSPSYQKRVGQVLNGYDKILQLLSRANKQ